MTMRLFGSNFTRTGLMAACALATTIALGAQAPQNGSTAAAKDVPTVAAADLEPLLPAVDGWTKTPKGGDKIVVSETCGYTFVDAIYTNGEAKVRVTLADTGFNQESLGLMAMIVVAFPDDYLGEVPPSTTIQRMNVGGMPAGARWDAAIGEGEFTILVGGRFVAKAEGTKVDSIDTLRALVERVDLKKLGALK